MKVGVVKEIKKAENRIALTSYGADELVRAGHEVFVEKDGGLGSGFTNEMYEKAGATILETPKEVFDTCEMVMKVKEPQPNEIEMSRDGQILFTYFHFAADRTLTEDFRDSGAIAVAYETVEMDNGALPLLIPMSEVAGRMATQEGAKYLEKHSGGRGILLGGVPGVDPGVVTVVGGGIVGMNSAIIAAGLGAKVYILDVNLDRLRYLSEVMPKNVITLYSNRHNLMNLIPQTDLLVGAILIAGAKAPKLVTRDMLRYFRPGSVIVDVAVDQGGCVETCKPTDHENPTFTIDDVVHYCVANMPGAVPFTSTVALTNATFPYAKLIANNGLDGAIAKRPELLHGINTYKKQITHKAVADAFDLKYVPYGR